MKMRLFCLISLALATSNQFSLARAAHKNRNTFRLSPLCLLTFLLTLLAPGSASAVSSTWTNKGGGSWTNTLNWASHVIADGPDATADFSTLALSNNVTVTLDYGSRTIGTLLFDDQNSTKHNWTLSPGTPANSVLTLAVSNGSPLITVGSATNTISAVVAGTNGLAKSSIGILLLSATNTYTGPTTVNAGTLLVNGKLVGGGAVTVAAGAILGGVGTLTGPVSVQAGATLSPGIGIPWPPHTLTVSNTLALAAGSTTMMQLNKSGGTNDQVGGITTLTYGGTLAVTNLAGTLATGDSFKLFDAAHYTGSFAAISPATPGIGIGWDLDFLAVDGSLRVTCATPFQLICASNKTLCLPPCPLLGSNLPVETVLRHFRYPSTDGNTPWAGLLVASDGLLYGTTHGGGNHGTVFKLNTDGTGYSVLYSLPGQSSAGYDPYARLVQGNSGALYGTAVNGGSNGVGTVFTLSTNGTGYADVHHFLTNGIDGQAPIGSLMIGSDGLLYGTTYLGGSNGAGTVFKLSTNGSGYTVLHHFSSTNGDGYCPQAGVVQGSDGMLYGATYYGGTNIYGTVFRLGTNGSGYAVLHHFNWYDGYAPLAALLIGSDGKLYGTTDQGGSNGVGEVFTLDTSGASFKVLHSFSSAGGDGSRTQFGDALVEGCDGALYGTTYQGGSSNLGTVFKLNKDGSDYAVEYSFTGPGNDGSYPYAGLAIGSGGTMYGTTSEGGSDNRGTVFRLDWGWSFDPPTLAGGCCSNSNLTILNSVVSSSNPCSQAYTRTWQATCNSNTATCSQTVTVQHTNSALVYKANNLIPLNQPASWTNNALPGCSGFGVWDATVAAANTSNSLGATLTWGGIRILNPGGPVTLTSGNTLTLMGVSGTGIDLSSATRDLKVNCALSLPNSQAWTVASGRTLTVGGGVSGVGKLIFDGSGVVSLDGYNTYTGGTVVSSGTLVVNGFIYEPIIYAGTLGGTGVIGGPTTVAAGATLAPGVGGIGTLTVTNTVGLAGTARMEINRTNASNCDQVIGITTLTYGGTLTVVNLGAALQAGDTFTLFTATTYSNAFASLNLPSLDDTNLVWDTSTLALDGTLRVQPQPQLSYMIPIHAFTSSNCCILIADQLDNGAGNTLAGIIPSLPCDCRFAKWDNLSQTWITTTYSTATGWADGSVTLRPGEGAFLCPCPDCTTGFNLTFHGWLPIPNNWPWWPVPIVQGYWYLLSQPYPGPGTYDTVVGSPPVGGVQAFTWDQLGNVYTACQFDPDDLTWQPDASGPTTDLGTAMWVHLPGSGGPPPGIPDFPCPTNYVTNYTITIQGCSCPIANELNHIGGNTLANIMPSLPCDAYFIKWDNASQTWITTTYSTVTGWANGGITLGPGEGAFLCPCPDCTTSFNLTFTGLQPAPQTVTMLPGHWYLLSRQFPGPGTYANITGSSPVGDERAYTCAGAYSEYHFNADTQLWEPSDPPPIAVGGALWVRMPGAGGLPPLPDVACPCDTLELILNTGFNEASGATYAVGDTDQYWTLVANPDILAPEIRPAWVIAPYPYAWQPEQPNSRWISAYRTANDNLNGTNDFEVLFCLSTNARDLKLDLSIRADDWAEVFLNGNFVGTVPQGSFSGQPVPLTDTWQPHFNTYGPLPNNHLLVRVVNQYAVAMGLNLVGKVTGSGLLSNIPRCCQTNLSIAGSKFNDINANGFWDQGELAIPSWGTILLNGTLQTTVTDGYGDYYFMHLLPGTYTVSESPGGYTQTYPPGGSPHNVTIGNGAGAVNQNFGNSFTNTPTNCCESAIVYTTAADFTGNGVLCNLVYDNGHLTFPPYISPLPFVNMSCSGRGTLVRIDANTGTVLGEYLTAPTDDYPPGGTDSFGHILQPGSANPSRVTVDLYGNVWVANRNDVQRGANKYGSVTCYALVIGGTRCDKYGNNTSGGQYLKPPFLYNSGAVSRHQHEVGEIAGLLKTSSGLGKILLWPGPEIGDGTVKKADDDCIIHYTLVPPLGARTLAVTAGNDIWVGGYANHIHQKLYGVNGTPVVLDGSPVSSGSQWYTFTGQYGAGGYGGFVDPNNVLWSAVGQASDLLRVDLNGAQSSGYAGVDLGHTHGNYGIAIDPCSTNNIWLSAIDTGNAYVLDAAGTPLAGPPYDTKSDGTCGVKAQGLAVDDRGNVWFAHGLSANTVAHLYSGSRGTIMGNWADPTDPNVYLNGTMNGPTGVAIDSNGKVWVSCYQTHKAMRIKPTGSNGLGAVDLEVDLNAPPSQYPAYPYNYSDMTGFIGLGVTRPSGFWDFIQDACPDNTEWGIITWTACPDTLITVQVRADNQVVELPKHDWLSVQNGISFCGHGILGAHLEVRVSMDRGTNCACTNSSACLESLSVQCCKDSTWQTNGQSSISIPLSPVSVSNAVPLTTNLWVGVTQPGGLAFHVAWSVNGQPVVTDQIPRGTPPTQTNVGFLYIYPLGSNSVRVVVSDGINPPVYDQTSVIVGDVTPPTWGVLPAYTTNAFAASVPNIVANVDTNSVRDDWSPFAQITVTQDVTPGTVRTQSAYLVALVATDAAGNSSTNFTAITVGPVLRITSPKEYAAFRPNNVPTPVTVQIQTNVTDVVRVNYWLDDTLVATSTNAPYGVSLTGVPPGSYALVAEAVNPAGLTSRSGAVRIGFVGPASIQIQLTSGQVHLDWPPAEGWMLQSADRVTGPWSDVLGATNPFLVTPNGLSQFYRLRLGP